MITPVSEDDPSERIKTDATCGQMEDRMEEVYFETKGAEEYLEIVQTEFEGGLRLLTLNLQRQDLQIEERLAERDLMRKRDRRRLKELILKGAQNSTIRPKPAPSPSSVFNEMKVEINPVTVPISLDKLQSMLKYIHSGG